MIRAAIRSLLARKLRLLMSTFAIVLGVAFVVGTLIFSATLNHSFTALFASTVGDVVVTPHDDGAPDGAGPSTRTVSARLVERLGRVPGAVRADGRVAATGVHVIADDGKAIGGFGPPALGGNWTDAPAGHGLPGLEIIEGRAPAARGEVVLDEQTAEKSGYGIGDRVRITTAQQEANLRPVLVGIAGFPHGGSLNGASYAAFETREAQRIFLQGKDVFDSAWVTAADGVTQDELRDRVAEVLPSGYRAKTGDQAAHDSADDLLKAIGFLTTFLLIFAGISLVVGTYLIVNTFSMLVAQRSRELALLRALGASRRQVTRSVLLEALVVGLFGSTMGLGLGVLLALALRALFGGFGLDLSGQPMIFPAGAAPTGYAVGVVVTLVAAYLPARRSGRIAPIQALRDDVALPESALRTRARFGAALLVLGVLLIVVGLGGVIDLDGDVWYICGGVLAVLLGVTALAPLIARPYLVAVRWAAGRAFGAVGTLAGGNALRNPRRTAATASALMIGLTLASTMAIVGASAKASTDRLVADTFTGDFVVSNVFGGTFSTSLADRLRSVDGVEQAVEVRIGLVSYDGGVDRLLGTRPEALGRLGVRTVQGSATALSRPGRVLVPDAFAREHDLAAGDALEVRTAAGVATWHVAGSFEENALLGDGFVTSLATHAAAGYPEQDALLVLYTAPGAAADGVADRIDAALDDQPTTSAQDQGEFAASQRAPIDQFILLIYALLALALLIAVLGIVNTLALSIIERTREVGLLRAVGLTRAQLRRVVALESMTISFLGAAMGAVLGVCFGLALMSAVRDEGLEVIAVPWGQIAVFLLASLVIGLVAAVGPALRASRLDVLAAIGTE